LAVHLEVGAVEGLEERKSEWEKEGERDVVLLTWPKPCLTSNGRRE
jgi:hypothetical protein